MCEISDRLKAEGRSLRELEIAKSLKELAMDISIIEKSTGLSKAQIEAL